MLNSLYDVGKYWIEKENIDKISILLDSNQLKKSSKRVIFLDFNKINENISFDKISLEAFDSEDTLKYFYKKGSSRGTNITPTSLITDVEKTYNTKFIKWFEDYYKKDLLVKNLFDCIKDNESIILSEINRIYNSLESENKNNVILSIRFVEDSVYHYMNEFELFNTILLDKANENYIGSKKNVGYSSCYLCDEVKEVYGNVLSAIKLTFGTGDKPGNTPEFSVLNQWKQSSICGVCALTLEAGKKYVEKYLNFSEFGLNYFIIPKIFFNQKEVFDELDDDLRLFENKRHVEDLTRTEDDFEDIVNELDDIVEFKYLYYESSNASFNILGYVESVLPSWLRRLYEKQKEISKLQIFSEDEIKAIFGDKIEGNIIEYLSKSSKYGMNTNNWYLSLLRDFFPYKTANKYYLELVTSIMGQQSINYDFLLSNLMKSIRSNWKNYDSQYIFLVKNVYKSMLLIMLFDELNLFKGGKKMSFENIESNSILDMIHNPDKKACFLMGVLTKKLTNIQYNAIDSTPFIKKLWDLNLSYDKIQKLYPMIINKLREYDAAYTIIEEEISMNLIAAEKNWKINKDEISYYFVLGFTMGNKINYKKEVDLDE